MQMLTMAICHVFQMPHSSPSNLPPGQALASSLSTGPGPDSGPEGQRKGCRAHRLLVSMCPRHNEYPLPWGGTSH